MGSGLYGLFQRRQEAARTAIARRHGAMRRSPLTTRITAPKARGTVPSARALAASHMFHSLRIAMSQRARVAS